MFNVEILADSLSPQGDRLTTMKVTFPRFILAEFNTHRMFSRNSASSRAIPFNKMVKMVEENPFIPIAWQKEHKGMQGSEYFTDSVDLAAMEANWLLARDRAVSSAWWLNEGKLTKQLCNRLLEPFMWTTMLITGPKSGWDNFFHLRCPQYNIGEGKFYKSKKDALKDVQNRGIDTETAEMFTITDFDWLKANKGQAEIHMMALAECVWDAVNESTPKVLKAGDWHIPFEDTIADVRHWGTGVPQTMDMVKVSVAMAARTSYTVVGEEKDIHFEAMIGLHDRLLAWDPPHSSPLEHCAQAMTNEEYWSSFGTTAQNTKGNGWCNNLKGFIPYRYMVDNGNQTSKD